MTSRLTISLRLAYDLIIYEVSRCVYEKEVKYKEYKNHQGYYTLMLNVYVYKSLL